jgi:hypothetical protein
MGEATMANVEPGGQRLPAGGTTSKSLVAGFSLAIALLLSGCVAGTGNPSGSGASLAPSGADGSGISCVNAASPAPGGITCERAIALANQNVDSTAELVSAESGPWSSVDPQPGNGPALGPATYNPARLVWAITYEVSSDICAPPAASPLASPCWPVTGPLTVILDYHTGAFIISGTT